MIVGSEHCSQNMGVKTQLKWETIFCQMSSTFVANFFELQCP